MTGTNGHIDTLERALAYRDAGLSVLPVARDGSKRPDVSRLPRVLGDDGKYHPTWEPFKEEPANRADVEQWFKATAPPGIGVIGGAASGGLECLDFDTEAETIFPAWRALVEAEAPGLYERLSVAQTPKPGYHVRYRCPDIEVPGNTKLAMNPAAAGDERTLIETRGEGGYAVAPGSPVECHKTGRQYIHLSGPELEHVQAIGIEEREVLIRAARSFDRSAPQEERKATGSNSTGLSPGDDYEQRGPDWPAILEPHGWAAVHHRGEVTYWRRPGKTGTSWSATTGACTSRASGRSLFCVFSSNADPFPGPEGGRTCSTHGRFAVYALLNHGGDFGAAAKALAEYGYGEQRKSGKGKKSGTAAKQPEPEEDGPGGLHEIDAEDLLAKDSPTALEFLPLLGRDGYFVVGWSHVLAGFPRCGKTELMTACIREWLRLGLKVLYFTEEAEGLWWERLSRRPGPWRGLQLVFGLGVSPSDLLARMVASNQQIVVVDTLRNLGILGPDENDNAGIARALAPWVSGARKSGKTWFGLHHSRKRGGDHGEGISGGHALMGAVDIALEVGRDSCPRRRVVKGHARIVQIQELMYEQAEGGGLLALGDPAGVTVLEVRARLLQALSGDWLKTAEVLELLAEPRPSDELLRQALQIEAKSGRIERDPPIVAGTVRGRTIRWRSATT